MAEEPRVGATTSAREHWLGYLEDLHTRIAGCFRRPEVISQRTIPEEFPMNSEVPYVRF